MSDPAHLDVAKLIVDDLDSLQRERRRHFLPALVIVMMMIGGMLAVSLRSDLLAQPWWQLAVQCVLWVLCLIVFPAIGLGMLFPSRGARIGLAITAVVLTVFATLGVPHPDSLHGDPHFGGGCERMIIGYAVMVLAMGLFSGAFVQRRKSSAVYWISAGISLTALTAITWQCPMTGAAHVLPSHLAVAAGLMVLTSLVGFFAHRRARNSDQGLPST